MEIQQCPSSEQLPVFKRTPLDHNVSPQMLQITTQRPSVSGCLQFQDNHRTFNLSINFHIYHTTPEGGQQHPWGGLRVFKRPLTDMWPH